MELRSRKGNAVIEFAIGSGMFLALFTGTFQFGYTFFVYNNLQSAVRAGARYGSMSVYDRYGQTLNGEASTFATTVKNVTVYGSPNSTGVQPVVPGLAPSNVDVKVIFEGGVPAFVTVSIQNYQVKAIFGNWTANRKPESSFRYVGRYAPPLS
jgi:hypothetical protein